MRVHIFHRTPSGDAYEHVATLDATPAPLPSLLDLVREKELHPHADGLALGWLADEGRRAFGDGDIVALEAPGWTETYQWSEGAWAKLQNAAPERTGPRAWECDACGGSIASEYFILHDAAWLAANGRRDGHLCIGCTEVRLGRRLLADDFTNAVVNSWPALTPEERAESSQAGALRFPQRDRDVPIYWSGRFLERLGLTSRYSRFSGG